MSRHQDGNPESTMSFGDHLEELRKRVFLSVIVPVPLMVALFVFAPQVRMLLCAPLLEAMRENNLPAQLSVLSPVETMMADLKISLIGALVIAAPWVLWQLWKFVAPGLRDSEQRFVKLLLPGSGILAISGLLLLYFVMLPVMLTVLVSFSVAPTSIVPAEAPAVQGSPAETAGAIAMRADDPAQPQVGEAWVNTSLRELRIALPVEGQPGSVEVAMVALDHPGTLVSAFRLSEYLDFVLLFAMCFALAFQLPIALLLLSWVGVVNPKMLRKNRKYAAFGVVVLAAAVAPGDLFSLIMVSAPLYLLFELSIVLIVIAPAKRVAAGTMLTKFGERFKDGSGDGAGREGDVGDE